MYLPLTDAAGRRRGPRPRGGRPRRPETILLVEDDAAVRLVTAAMLRRRSGTRVLDAAGGMEAIRPVPRARRADSSAPDGRGDAADERAGGGEPGDRHGARG